MARSFASPCEPEMKWVLKAGINIDPATLAKNLTIFCTVAFSATVLYVMCSNSKKPQASFCDDEEEVSGDEHTIHCKTRCRHTVVGTRTSPLNFGASLEEDQSPSPSCPHPKTSPPTEDESCSAETQTTPVNVSTTSTASGPDEFRCGITEDPDCVRAKIGFRRHFKEEHWQEVTAMREEFDDGSRFEGYIYGIFREKGSKVFTHRLCGGVSLVREKTEQGDGLRFKEACTQFEGANTEKIRKNSPRFRPRHCEVSTQTERGASACKGRLLKLLHAPEKDVGSPRPYIYHRTCTGRSVPKEEARSLLQKSRDQGTCTRGENSPELRTRARLCEQTRIVKKDEASHSAGSTVVGRCVEGRKEGGITNVQPKAIDPLEQTKSSLRTLTETEHWSKMSLPEQYECLELLDSTLAAASEQLNGRAKGQSRTGDRRIRAAHRTCQGHQLSANHMVLAWTGHIYTFKEILVAQA